MRLVFVSTLVVTGSCLPTGVDLDTPPVGLWYISYGQGSLELNLLLYMLCLSALSEDLISWLEGP
jgi:hypothetical protein